MSSETFHKEPGGNGQFEKTTQHISERLECLKQVVHVTDTTINAKRVVIIGREQRNVENTLLELVTNNVPKHIHHTRGGYCKEITMDILDRGHADGFYEGDSPTIKDLGAYHYLCFVKRKDFYYAFDASLGYIDGGVNVIFQAQTQEELEELLRLFYGWKNVKKKLYKKLSI